MTDSLSRDWNKQAQRMITDRSKLNLQVSINVCCYCGCMQASCFHVLVFWWSYCKWTSCTEYHIQSQLMQRIFLCYYLPRPLHSTNTGIQRYFQGFVSTLLGFQSDFVSVHGLYQLILIITTTGIIKLSITIKNKQVVHCY